MMVLVTQQGPLHGAFSIKAVLNVRRRVSSSSCSHIQALAVAVFPVYFHTLGCRACCELLSNVAEELLQNELRRPTGLFVLRAGTWHGQLQMLTSELHRSQNFPGGVWVLLAQSLVLAFLSW